MESQTHDLLHFSPSCVGRALIPSPLQSLTSCIHGRPSLRSPDIHNVFLQTVSISSQHVTIMSHFYSSRRRVHENNVYIEDRRLTDRPTSHFGKFRTGHPIRFMFGSRVGFQGRRIKWRYFRLDQIQDHGRQPSCIILNGHISETVHPVLFVFGSRVKVQEKIMREE